MHMEHFVSSSFNQKHSIFYRWIFLLEVLSCIFSLKFQKQFCVKKYKIQMFKESSIVTRQNVQREVCSPRAEIFEELLSLSCCRKTPVVSSAFTEAHKPSLDPFLKLCSLSHRFDQRGKNIQTYRLNVLRVCSQQNQISVY